MFNMVWIFAHSPYLWPEFGFFEQLPMPHKIYFLYVGFIELSCMH